MVQMQFKLDPYKDCCAFIFCNKRRNGIKILRYDSNGFILASKKLLEDMKFQWPKTPEEVKEIKKLKINKINKSKLKNVLYFKVG